MAKVRCRAVIMGYASGGESTYEFEAGDNFLDMPVDEVVAVLMQQIDQRKILKEPVRYELNSANRYLENQLVSAMGALLMNDGSRLPFMAMIGAT